jgi:hypothetical protein
MENNANRPNNADEIDVTQVFAWIARGFRRIGNSTIYGIALLRNVFFSNKLFFSVVIIAGLAMGIVYSKLLSKKYYKSSMVLSCDYLNTQILGNTIEKLNLLCQEKEKIGLAETLKLDVNLARNIQRFEFRSFVSEDDIVEMEVLREQLNNVTEEKRELVDKIIAKLKIDNKNAYEISVYVYDPEIVKPLEMALVNYFSSNQYIKRRVEINKINLKKRQQKLVKESNKLDSLKAVLFQNFEALSKTSRGSNNVILSDEQLANPLDVFTKDLALNTEILAIEEDLYVSPDFEIVDGFTSFKEPESASLFEILFVSFWISILMGYIIIGLWKFDRMLARIPMNA